MEYKIIAFVAGGLIALYLAVRLLGQYAFGRLVDAELSQVIHGDEHKVKGRYE